MKRERTSRSLSGGSQGAAHQRKPQSRANGKDFIRVGEDRLRLTSQSAQTQRIEALGQLAGVLAHEFKNILQSILINAELAADMIADGTAEREYVNQIIEAALQGRDLVGRINSHGMRRKEPHEPVDARLIVQDALNDLCYPLRPDITCRQWLEDGPSPVLVDPAQLREVVRSLYTNALEAMSAGKGFLGVSLKRVKISLATPALISDLAPGEYVRLTVRDTGGGISPEIKDKIFDPFFTTAEPGRKTGMGLAVVYAVVKHSRGSIMVVASPGKGARFRLFFPLWSGVAHP